MSRGADGPRAARGGARVYLWQTPPSRLTRRCSASFTRTHSRRAAPTLVLVAPPLWRVLGVAALPLAVLGAGWPRLTGHVRHVQSAPSATGRVEGLVIISKALAARRPRFRLYGGDGAAMLPPAAAEPNERDNVIVYLTPASGE